MRIGIDVGGSHIGLGLVNKDCKLVLKDEKDYDKRQEDMSNIVLETIIELINKNIDNNNVKKEEINLETKKMLDEMHKQKIDMSDEIYVINFGGYI